MGFHAKTNDLSLKTLPHNAVSSTPQHERDSNSQLPYDHDHHGPR